MTAPVNCRRELQLGYPGADVAWLPEEFNYQLQGCGGMLHPSSQLKLPGLLCHMWQEGLMLLHFGQSQVVGKCTSCSW